jgi:hypothetical protein
MRTLETALWIAALAAIALAAALQYRRSHRRAAEQQPGEGWPGQFGWCDGCGTVAYLEYANPEGTVLRCRGEHLTPAEATR